MTQKARRLVLSGLVGAAVWTAPAAADAATLGAPNIKIIGRSHDLQYTIKVCGARSAHIKLRFLTGPRGEESSETLRTFQHPSCQTYEKKEPNLWRRPHSFPKTEIQMTVFLTVHGHTDESGTIALEDE
jgi:hypothetical protein